MPDVSWNFSETVTGNTGAPLDMNNDATMTGKLKIVIRWSDPDLPKPVFKSDCAAELPKDDGDSFEVEPEGTVQKFPGQSGPRRAVASINGTGVGDEAGFVHLSIELGTTCFEEVNSEGGLNEFEIDIEGTATHFKFQTDGVLDGGDHGIAGLPDGCPISAISDDPCPGVDIGLEN